jgi:hypothetical protein
MVRANQELLEYREDSARETSSLLPPEQAERTNSGGEEGTLSPEGMA